MRIFNRSHVPWLIFVVLATIAASWIYFGNFHPRRLPAGFGLPPWLVQKPSEHRSVGGTPLGLTYGTIAFAIFIFAEKMRDSFKPAPPKKTDAGAPAPSPLKTVTSGSTPMASTVGDISTPTARAKTVVGSTIIAAPLNPSPSVAAVGAATKPEAPLPGAVASAKRGAAEGDADSEAVLVEFLERQVLPYLKAKRGERFRLGNSRFSDDAFRFVKLRVPEVYRSRVEEIQAWCDERRMLDLQTKLHHWLHAWLFVHVPFSFLLLMLTAWHAFVTLFYY